MYMTCAMNALWCRDKDMWPDVNSQSGKDMKGQSWMSPQSLQELPLSGITTPNSIKSAKGSGVYLVTSCLGKTEKDNKYLKMSEQSRVNDVNTI